MDSYEIQFPLWDEAAAATVAWLGLVTRWVEAYADVDTGFGGPHLGRLHLWGEGFAPGYTRRVNYVLGVGSGGIFWEGEACGCGAAEGVCVDGGGGKPGRGMGREL